MKIIIIGAGITGLSTAFFALQKGYEVSIFESESEPGGLAGFFEINGDYIEKYYHHSFTSHTDLYELIKILKIEDKYFTRNAKTGFYYKNYIYPFVSGKDLLLFKPLTFINRIRLGLTSLFMMRIKNSKNLEEKNALDWLRRFSGNEACNVIWEPLLRMKFGDGYKKISAAWIWNRVVDRKNSGTGKDVLGYLKGGYKTLFNSLIREIEYKGGKIFYDSQVNNILIEDGKCKGVKVNNQLCNSDVVLSTVPIPSFLSMAPFLSDEYVDRLTSIKYQGSICVVLKLKNPLSEYYWINVSDPKSPFVGIIEHTNFIPAKYYADHHIVYLTKYASSNSEIFNASNESIFNDFTSYLKRIFPNFNSHDIVRFWLFRDRFSQPVFVKNYSRLMPDYKTPIENLYMLNTSQIYPESRSLNSSIRVAQQFISNL